MLYSLFLKITAFKKAKIIVPFLNKLESFIYSMSGFAVCQGGVINIIIVISRVNTESVPAVMPFNAE